ncbi:MAG TPA: tetratricopeptide repeat protein [Verrucomicrobiota bacterium]|nr:tetratricopeptide repeat protein [Verrucomicrobiota bacterium]HQL79003.1 tetratricopeptide repeat protein [Verrucomicrobiota bacterium]
MNGSRSLNRPFAWLIAGAVLLGSGWVWWLCRHDHSIPFLPQAGAAEWIVYPKPPDTVPHGAAPLWAEFRRSFVLAAKPAAATLSVRAFKQGTVRVNGQPVDDLPLREQDWKSRHASDVSRFLKAGENEISVTVSNSLGMPALWLALEGDAPALHSDSDWQVSLVGAVWQNAALASMPPAIRAGNPLFGRERMADSLRRAWPQLLLILALAAALAGAGRILRLRNADFQSALLDQQPGHSQPTESRRSRLTPAVMLGVIILSWVVLFGNNLPQLAALLGFDRDGHQQYIDYILQQRALPLADDGWQMYQPPLFYLLSACIIGPFGWTASADAAILTLRAFSTLTGIVHLLLVFLCLRLLFPQRPQSQMAGLLLAGFLPMSLCLSHHITNENLAALFVTAALYFTLRLLRAETRAAGFAAAAGACLGLALLTKFSAVLAIPIILAALVWRRWSGGPAGAAVSSAGLFLLSLLAVCGWHFARVWHRFGTPLIGNWDPRLPFAWWQDPGCHTASWYQRFGEALACPLFSSITGFADGLYATLWADGLCSGSALMNFRPQWNYDLMNAGCLLSLLATALLFAGALTALARFIRRPTPEWFLLLGLLFAFAAGIGLMSLRVASHAQVKAFYALPALFPLCAVAAVGWDFVAGLRPVLRALLRVGLLAWAITVYSAFWIRSGNAFTHAVRGVSLADDGRHAEAADAFSRALELDANSLRARVGLAEAWRRLGRGQEAHQQAALALQRHPREAAAHAQAALLLSLDRRYPEAVDHLRQALAQAPDHPTAGQQLAACLAFMGQHQQVIEACRQGLRVDPFNPTLHHLLANAAAETGDMTNAVAHLRFALALKPQWPEARSLLALALTSLGRQDEAAAQYEQAIREAPSDPNLHYLYAAALASHGSTRAAVDRYRQALALRPDLIEALNNLAWILAANPDDALRNGAEAVRLAERACELSQHAEPVLLGTLAAAYAEAARFDDAVKTAEKARDLAAKAGLKDVAERNSQLLELYRAGKPYHDPSPRPR